MNIITYTNRIPDKWLIKDFFFDRNPNLSYLITYGKDNLHSILIDGNVSVEELELDLLPDSTQIFPGHSLNNYLPPPYLREDEKKRNLFLQLAATGNKPEFNKELKNFSCDRESDTQLVYGKNQEHDDSGID